VTAKASSAAAGRRPASGSRSASGSGAGAGKAAPRRKPTKAPAPAPVEPAGTWVLQAEAAARTGYSVSAIRKWRRAGIVADRTKTTATGVERVEVRLEDVQARVAERPPMAAAPVAALPRKGPENEAGPPTGSAIIAIADLEGLFQRLSDAERRADAAESRLQEAEVDARFMSGQLAELRRQVQAARVSAEGASRSTVAAPVSSLAGAGAGSGVGRMSRPTPAPAPVPTPAPEPEVRTRAAPTEAPDLGIFELVALDLGSRVRPAAVEPAPPAPAARAAPPRPRVVARPAPVPADGREAEPNGRHPAPAPPVPSPPRSRPSNPRPTAAPPSRPPAAPTVDFDALAFELRRLYAKLDDYRREPTISPARERHRERDLGDYDTILLRACSALAIPTGLRPGEPVTIERRGALTQALARAGLDVRTETRMGRAGG
jgi:hypothetical protein